MPAPSTESAEKLPLEVCLDVCPAGSAPQRWIRFKKLELQGFKSFPDRTELLFNHAISAIVGPNGCGKSNILDAIRWVLGEQGPNQLRARSMADVIFNGAAGRKPVGMAEITLTVECPAGALPIAFEEVEVTRRLYRSGDSEYLINRTPCRLKDIVDLFLDTGIGKGAYALIEQGRVDALVTARPEDRRVFIEQIAGVEKYKVRKKEALSKLESTENNLARVLDVAAEVRSRRQSLSRQARRAARYRTIRSELEDLRRVYLAGRYARIRADGSALSRDAEVVQNRMARIAAQLGLQSAALQQSRLQVTAVQTALARAGEAADQAELRMDYLDRRIRDMLQHDGDLERESVDADREAGELDGQSTELGRRRVHLIEEVRNRVDRLAVLQAAAGMIDDEYRGMAERIADGRDRLTRLRERRRVQINALARLQNALTGIEEGIRRVTQRMETLDLEWSERVEREAVAKQKRDGAEGEVARLDNLRLNHQNEAQTAVEVYEDCSLQRNETQYALRDLENEYMTIRSRMQSLEEIIAAGEDLDSGVQAVRAAFIVGDGRTPGSICGTLADLYDTDPENETMVAAVLHPHLQDIVVVSTEAFTAIDRFLMEHHLSRVTIRHANAFTAPHPGPPPPPNTLPIDRFIRPAPGFDALFHHLLRHTIVIPESDYAPAWWAVCPDGVCVTPDGRILGPGPATRTVSRSTDQRIEYRRRRNELKFLTDRADAVRRQMSIRSEARDAAEEALRLAARERDAWTARLAADDQSLAVARRDLEHARATWEQACGRGRQVAAEQEACRRELTELKDRRESVLKEIEAAGNDDGVAFEIDAVEREQERLQVDSAGIRDRMMEIRLQLQSTEERIESVKRETERLDEETHRLTDLATRLRDQATKKRAQRTAAQTDRQALEGELTHGMQAMPGMKQQVGNIQAQLERTCQAEKELATQLADLEKKDRQLERELSDIRVRQAGMTSAAEALTADAFGDLDTAADDLGRIPDGDEIEDWRKQIDILQSNLDMLGDVNLAAEQEHRELVERNRFLDEQIRDLQDSIASLRATIQQINKASRIRFSEAFETVNTHFGQVFQRLFSGGDAFLELIHPDDPLESGVDIVCKPPGKRARTIDLLSGGEKALAALALLLAGFRYRPSPLLFLDEVDAPLDDANVERFTEFLKELAEVTQVVMVTHNATTMEAADVLYGITMEEPGISRLVSARLAML